MTDKIHITKSSTWLLGDLKDGDAFQLTSNYSADEGVVIGQHRTMIVRRATLTGNNKVRLHLRALPMDTRAGAEVENYYDLVGDPNAVIDYLGVEDPAKAGSVLYR